METVAKEKEKVAGTELLNLSESPSVFSCEQLLQPFWGHPGMEPTEAAQVSFTRTPKDGHSIAVIDGKEQPIAQELEVYPARKGSWTSVGLTFVNEGIRYCAITGKVYDEEGSWYNMFVPDNEMAQYAVRIPRVKLMEEGTLQSRKQGR